MRDVRTRPNMPAGRSRARPSSTCDSIRPAATCRACAQLDPITACDACIGNAGSLFAAGKDPATIARLLAVREPRAAYLVAIARDRQQRDALRVDVVANAGPRALVAAATGFDRWAARAGPANVDAARIPDETVEALCERLRGRRLLTTGEIVQAAGYSSLTTLKRDLGILKQPARRNGGEPVYSDLIDVDVAGWIVRALGISPCEVPWL